MQTQKNTFLYKHAIIEFSQTTNAGNTPVTIC